MKYTVDKKGFYGNFGGAFVPEMLFPNLDELEKNYNKIINDSCLLYTSPSPRD